MGQKVYIVSSRDECCAMIYGVFSTMEKALVEARRLKTDVNGAEHVYDDWALIGAFLRIDSYDVE